jgi:hypothetical protein
MKFLYFYHSRAYVDVNNGHGHACSTGIGTKMLPRHTSAIKY